MPCLSPIVGNVLLNRSRLVRLLPVAVEPRETDLLWPDPQTGPWWITTWWRVQHGVPTPVGFQLKSWVTYPDDARRVGTHHNLPTSTEDVELPRIDGQLLRSLPVGGILTTLREQLAEYLNQNRDQTHWPEEWLQKFAQWRDDTAEERAAFNSTRKPGRDLGDAHYRETAAVYAAAVEDGKAPTVAVAAHFHVSKSAAAKKVARARERGFLPPTTRGRVGPLTEEL